MAAGRSLDRRRFARVAGRSRAGATARRNRLAARRRRRDHGVMNPVTPRPLENRTSVPNSRALVAPPSLRHPLELIPWFRRWPHSHARDLVYTFVWNTLLALVFAGMAIIGRPNVDIGRMLVYNLVFAHCIGYAIHALFVVGALFERRIDRAGRLAQFAYYTLIPLAGVLIGYAVGNEVLGVQDFFASLSTPRVIAAMAFLSIVISAMLFVLMMQREQAAQAEAAFAREQARVANAERAAALAQLKALEAQVEPHFLYNTLAHVASMIDAEPVQARAMLDRLIGLLRATAQAAEAPATLGAQIDLVRDWLGILAMRMGPRLRWSIDVPIELRAAALPPALLQPLVENAVKHGLEPKIDGGAIDIAARVRDAALELVVADTGAGFGAASAPLGGSTSLGLANLRARLATLYGGAASLVIAENQPNGVRAVVRLPLSRER
jgi:hypothetical protein